MSIIKASTAKNTLYDLIDEAISSHEPIHITSKRGNAVLISESDWRAVQETMYLQSIPGMVKSINLAREEGPEAGSRKLDW